MRRILQTAALTIAVAFLTGCAFLKAPSEKQLATYQAVTTEAIYVGSTIDMQQKPEHRPIYMTVDQLLGTLQGLGNYDQVKLMQALSQLPIKEFKGESGAFYIRETLFAWSVLTGIFYDEGTTPVWVKATIDGVKAGLDKSLAESPAAAAKLAARTVTVAPPKR